jgi:hypothetical protein
LLITLLQWSDKTHISVLWTLIASAEGALSFANKVHVAPRVVSQFACTSQMMHFVADKALPRMPARSDWIVVDVSGDGRDNCNPPHSRRCAARRARRRQSHDQRLIHSRRQ